MPDVTVTELLADLSEDIDGIVLFSPPTSYYERFADLSVPVLVVSDENDVDADPFIQLPVEFTDVVDRIRFGIDAAFRDELISEGDELLCVVSMFSDGLDTVTRIRASRSDRSGVYDLFANSRAEPAVIRDVLELAIELGRKGQKGKPVGALFVVGDAGQVMTKSRPLSYNPFEKSHVHIGDPIVTVMLKEFSRLDGAFVVSDAGKIVSAYRYLQPAVEDVDIPKGLGARHMAAGAITQATDATAIVLSESDGLVRAFKNGSLVLELDPEEY